MSPLVSAIEHFVSLTDEQLNAAYEERGQLHQVLDLCKSVLERDNQSVFCNEQVGVAYMRDA